MGCKYRDEPLENQGWTPPAKWLPGKCRGCGERFDPKFTKQYWCEHCRSRAIPPYPVGEIKSVIGIGFIGRFKPERLTWEELAQAADIQKNRLKGWNSRGILPGNDPMAIQRLCYALGVTLEKLEKEVTQ